MVLFFYILRREYENFNIKQYMYNSWSYRIILFGKLCNNTGSFMANAGNVRYIQIKIVGSLAIHLNVLGSESEGLQSTQNVLV